MKALSVLLLSVAVLGGCSSAPSAEDREAAKKLRAASEKMLKDEEALVESLETSEAPLRAYEHKFMLAYIEKHDEASLQHLAAARRAQTAFDDARASAREVRRIATRAGALADAFEGGDEDLERLAEAIGGLVLELNAAIREQKLVNERMKKARAAVAALGKD